MPRFLGCRSAAVNAAVSPARYSSCKVSASVGSDFGSRSRTYRHEVVQMKAKHAGLLSIAGSYRGGPLSSRVKVRPAVPVA